MLPPPPTSTLFPYTTLFRSVRDRGVLLGAIEIAESLEVRDTYLRSSIWSTVLATASMVLVSGVVVLVFGVWLVGRDRKSTRLNSSHVEISYAVFCLKKKKEV